MCFDSFVGQNSFCAPVLTGAPVCPTEEVRRFEIGPTTLEQWLAQF
jgi:hypothetical protein